MTQIRATCPECGEIVLAPRDVELEIVPGVRAEVADGSCYRFSCPTCDILVTKPADERIARLLRTGGVPVIEPRRRPAHPERPPAGRPLTHDDLLEFHQLLETADWFHGLEAMTP